MNCRKGHRAGGFSLLELMIVVGILLVVAAMAIPKLMTTLADVKLRGAINSASGIIQQARMMAIKDDKQRQVKYSNASYGGVIFVDTDSNGAASATEPQALLGATILAYSAPTGLAALDNAKLGYSPVTATTITYNSRGLPCSSSTNCGVGMVFYFTDSRTVGSPGWGAVSVSPAGRIKTWLWSGATWSD